MPYITPEKRTNLDLVIDQLHQQLVKLQVDDELNNMEGNLNYVITALLTKIYSTSSYSEINDAVGMLECCKQEYYRRVAIPYEDQKCFENGDVFPSYF